MLKIEIFPEDVRVATRTTKPKDDKPGRDIYEQDAYAYIGGKFPVHLRGRTLYTTQLKLCD